MQEPFQQIALNKIENLSKMIENSGFLVSNPNQKLYNYEVIVNSKNEQVKLQVYFGKKGVKIVLQGDKDSPTHKQLDKMIFGERLFAENITEEINFDEYIGTDESGKGDYFGPLVVAAVYVDKKTAHQLKQDGVKDSKLINDTNIKVLEGKIKKVVKNNYEIVQINPEKYNTLYTTFKNLNMIMAWAHSKAIQNLLLKINCSNVISDKFGNEKLITDELKKKNIEVNLFQTPKGERYTAVAAASILARSKVIDWFKYKSNELGFEIPKGSGDAVNTSAKRVMDHFDDKYLMKMIKFHFKNSKSIFKN